MIKFSKILQEIGVNVPKSFTKEDMKSVKVLLQYFGDGNSGFESLEPMREDYTIHSFNSSWAGDKERKEAFIKLIQKYGKLDRFYLINDFYWGFTSPYKPSDCFDIKISIHPPHEITIEIPYNDEEGTEFVGWFEPSGEYIGDVVHYDENGVKIA